MKDPMHFDRNIFYSAFSGSRFALMQVKVMIYKTLLQFSLNVNEKTQIPIQLKASPVTLSSKDGIHLQLLPRHKI